MNSFTAKTPASKRRARRQTRLFIAGLLFELLFLALGAFLPEGSSLAAEVRYYSILIHIPIFLVLDAVAHSGGGAIFVLVAALFLMSCFWALMFKLILSAWGRLEDRLKPSKRLKLIIHCAIVVIAAMLLSCGIIAARPQTPTPFTATPEVKFVVDSNTAFALDLYQKLKDQPGNLFFSPFSISSGLAMTYAGARNQTEIEMARTLHFSQLPANLHAAFGVLTARMKGLSRWNNLTLTTANSLWCQQDYSFAKTFLDLISQDYAGEARLVNFRNSPQAAGREINQWAERQTKGKIKEAVTPEQMTTDTGLILCNVIYFKGKWKNQFQTKDTAPGDFKVSTNQTVTVPMMKQKARFKTAHSDDHTVEMLELPYIGRDLSMIILLPATQSYSETPNTLPDLEQQLTPENLQIWLSKLDQALSFETWVTLPRFTTAQSFALAKELKSLGMPSAFEAAADFSGMEATNNLYVSDVFHKAFIEVNEAGTEAAAMTAVGTASKSRPEHFFADHPFLFLIRENGSGTILFLGRVVDPTK